MSPHDKATLAIVAAEAAMAVCWLVYFKWFHSCR